MGKVIALTLLMFFDNLSAKEETMPIADFFNKVNYENMETLCRQFYDPQIRFVDPLGEVNGIDNMIKYYRNLYQNVISIRFDSVNHFDKNSEKVFEWKMHLKHKKINGGDLIIVDGVSVFRYSLGKVVYHRDYFDLGVMLYENVPIIGSIITRIRKSAHGME